ncbi:site-specific integrase [Bacteroides pyogenes]|uniref:site-specific integrase n=1 Tax=Bacteroides pyogenes TaxID=310300 RepID=UPI001E02E26A|nr:site-specific integrase [Bacteroides pyogenes]MBR8709069.1 Tyrosine recombinase XerC [Bacteroides pyogenes]MBR8717868.1 Tyrosine recombinase XerC [Bacteroides pyogenes]MBR8747377.1 Tyrosine recombinase XerC [Bacteroides pyogenes]MBR8757720.1 Tyrosine recombinase XerC [Bacteroides pyogenes]MBR8780946.1 Tyrosine recombinase XerC [Bacteroides pyogenes]
MRSTFKILFYINRQKTKADGNTAILCRITIDGKSTAITTGEECKVSEWNTKQGLTTDRKTNQRISEFRELVENTYRDILVKDGVVSVELIKNRLQGIATNPTTLLAMSRAELQSVKESVGRSRAEGTYLNLFHSDRNLREFVENKGVQDIPIGTITEDLFEKYRFFLKKRGLKASTVNTNLCWLSRLMFRAVSKRIIRFNPFENAKYEKEEKKIRFLQKSDVMKLMAMRMNDREAEQARLMFIFSCFTGLAISDMENLEYRHVQTAADGQRYIRKERQKTKVEFIVPLHPIAESIISHCRKEQKRSEEHLTVKEKGDHLVFHRDCSRSVMDTKLSIVGKACGIRGRLSYHMARHTFGTMSLSAGIPIESIAKMMGHASISSTQVYAQVTDNKISEDMDKLIAKQSAKEKGTVEREVCEPSEVQFVKWRKRHESKQ